MSRPMAIEPTPSPLVAAGPRIVPPESLGSARPARNVNPVILALVVALRDVEHRRAASNMERDGPPRRTTA